MSETILERPAEAKAGFRSLTEVIDTTTPAARMMMMQMVRAFAEVTGQLRERTNAVWILLVGKHALAGVRQDDYFRFEPFDGCGVLP
jgi:DNA invertase Pin-like site-specific DNA recombinase